MTPERIHAGAHVAEAARRWIGTPYRHQAALRGAGCDCLGLVRGLWRELLGAEPAAVPPYGPGWAEGAQGELLLDALARHFRPATGEAPGDLLVFRMRAGAPAGHLGVQSRVGTAPTFIHAYSRHGVVENALSAPWRRRVAARFRFPLN
ncbi:peptidase [Alkalilacustris brevis]|uniref:peptidase n=1 Tax=Alkalilacustris brevis TaxID=2026338 RepID=UPI000E0DD84F|nr:peptidase [Alkalilacustris brevis]